MNLRIGIGQINLTVGDLKSNSKKILQTIGRAKSLGVDIVTFPELSITGYPPEDLALKPYFVKDNIIALKKLAKQIDKIVAIVGFIDSDSTHIYNAASVIYARKVFGVYRKICLPNYSVFDEKRYFTSGNKDAVFQYGNCIFGINICEDIWEKKSPLAPHGSYNMNLLFNISASPYHMGKAKIRMDILKAQARKHKLPVVYTNLVGGQDELVFDGQSLILDKTGNVISKANAFEEGLVAVDIEISDNKRRTKKSVVIINREAAQKNKPSIPTHTTKTLDAVAEVYQALSLGLRDYVRKNGFKKVTIGLSGGIDSALVASLASDVAGRENVIGVFMPSRYSSEESRIDAVELARNLNISFLTIPIEDIYKAYLAELSMPFAHTDRGTAEENLQARIRGNMLMALSNKFGYLVLTTGNKSEMSTGYATLYGDMAGGFAVIKDVPKMLVYKLAAYRNSIGHVIPDRILTKEPTAELKPNQKDSDSLPPYELLDPIIKAYVEEHRELKSIVKSGFDKDIVKRVIGLIDKSEYKRRQAPPGIKITPLSFGKDRRMPITNGYVR